MAIEIKVPDIGADEVEITEILVKVGDKVEAEQSLITVEGDKASMEVPSPQAGIVKEIKVSVGDKTQTGALIMIFDSADGAADAAPAQAEEKKEAAPAAAPKAAAGAGSIQVKAGAAGKVFQVPTSVGQKVEAGDVEGAKELCRNTRGPVASICYQGLMHIDEHLDDIERSVSGYGTVQAANLEKGCSWIKLFIAMAPSLGFLGTVIGMVMAFDQIQQAGDISPTIVASGMKVALITTIFGIIVALILMVFYNYILSKVEHLTSQMEESAVTLMDIIAKNK